jgi:hypothetical protein
MTLASSTSLVIPSSAIRKADSARQQKSRDKPARKRPASNRTSSTTVEVTGDSHPLIGPQMLNRRA